MGMEDYPRAMLEFEEKRAYDNMKRLCDLGPRVSGSKSEEAAVKLIKRQFEEYELADVMCHELPHTYYDAKLAMIQCPTTGISLNGVPCWMSTEAPEQQSPWTQKPPGHREATGASDRGPSVAHPVPGCMQDDSPHL